MSNVPQKSLIDQYIEKGLLPFEAEQAASYPLPVDPNQFAMPEILYLQGNDCLTISVRMPAFPIAAIQKARAELNWDRKRNEIRTAAMLPAQDAMKGKFAGGLRYMGNFLEAHQAEYEQALMMKILNPDREKMPVIPKDEYDRYLNTMKFMRDTLNPPSQRTSSGGANGTNPNANTLVSINIVGGQPSTTIETSSKPIDITPDRAELIRLARLKKAGMLPDDNK